MSCSEMDTFNTKTRVLSEDELPGKEPESGEEVLATLPVKPQERYKFIRTIGFGGMKGVLLVFDQDTGREIAMAIMPDFRERPIGELSGGQMQRVFLCRAIISSPRVLILDEPSTYVDSKFEQEFYSLLNDLNHRMSIVMVSHDLGTICSYVKTIACVNRTLYYHDSNLITPEQMELYNCPI